MSRFSSNPKLLLLIVFLALTQGAAAADWPVKGDVDLSSGFGDYRLNRFHAGVDIRTGGQVGTPVYSPVNGWVMRVKMSYDGYGKGLYIKNLSDHVFVFGHLDSFAPKIDSVVKNTQNTSRRYYQDLHFPKDSIPVSKGELIGFTGRTGTKGPHLHFEIRDPENQPMNPLLHHYAIRDIERSRVDGIKFQVVDDHSLFFNGKRILERPTVVIKNRLTFNIDTVFYFNQPFGVLAAAYDYTRMKGMPIAPYMMALFYDDSLQYEVVLDTIDFNTQRAVNLEYDVVRIAQGDKRTRRLFHMEGNDFAGSRSYAPGNGVFGTQGYETYGLHHGKIIVMDHMGYVVEMFFDFVWGPQENVYDLDSTVAGEGDRVTYYLTPKAYRHDFPIDSVLVMQEIDGNWVKSPAANITFQEKRKIVLEVERSAAERAPMQLNIFAFECEMPDIVLAEVSDDTPSDLSVDYEVVDDGLVVTIDTDRSGLEKPAIELYSGDSLLGIEYADFYRGKYAAFVPPRSKYPHIDKILCRLSQENAAAQASIETDIYLVGADPEETITAGKRFTLHAGRDKFYQPRFIEVRADKNRPGFLQILPEAFVCRADFDMTVNAPGKTNPAKSEGVCWWDKQENEWVWLDNNPDGSGLNSALTGGGTFEIKVDEKRPEISALNITNGLTYFDPRQEITFTLSDDLSGFEDDRNILIEIDGQWMIPEYDPNLKICKTAPLKPLADGRHELKIVVTDRVGNKTEKKLHFFVKRQN